ncbi:MAG: DUF309 domain-containing protein [Terriglobia bacterium]
MDPARKQKTFRRGIDCFNRREFFTCHEVLEEIWLDAPEEEKPFYQGLIQVAAAFHHWQTGNLRGAGALLRRGVAKLRRYPPDAHGIDLAGLLAALAPWLDHLQRGQVADEPPLPAIRPPRPP